MEEKGMTARREEKSREASSVTEGQLATCDKLLITCGRRAFPSLSIFFFLQWPHMVLTLRDFRATL